MSHLHVTPSLDERALGSQLSGGLSSEPCVRGQHCRQLGSRGPPVGVRVAPCPSSGPPSMPGTTGRRTRGTLPVSCD